MTNNEILLILGNQLFPIDYIKKTISISGNTTIHNNVDILSNLNILHNIHNYGNTKINNLLDTNTLVVNNGSNLKGLITIENTLESDYYKFDYENKIVNINGVTTLEKDVKMKKNVEIYENLNNYGNVNISRKI